jgi:predicted nucleotidyltransferase
MDILDDELVRFWKTLNENGVRYIMVGGFAIRFHGFNRSTDGECLEMASIADLEGIKVPFLHINHLIANKRIVNRPKDQVDVIELEKIRKIREEGDQ